MLDDPEQLLVYSLVPQSLENTPMGDELKWLLNKEGGCIFGSCDISHKNISTAHVALVNCTCSVSAIPLFVMLCLLNNTNGACLLLLLRCLLLNITAA